MDGRSATGSSASAPGTRRKSRSRHGFSSLTSGPRAGLFQSADKRPYATKFPFTLHFSRQRGRQRLSTALPVSCNDEPMDAMPQCLLASDEPAPVSVRNENGASPFLIVADHAGNLTPASLGRLGVSGGGVGAPHRHRHRHRRGLPALGRRSGRAPYPAGLFPPHHRLQPHAGLRDLDPGDQRIHHRAGQYRFG